MGDQSAGPWGPGEPAPYDPWRRRDRSAVSGRRHGSPATPPGHTTCARDPPCKRKREPGAAAELARATNVRAVDNGASDKGDGKGKGDGPCKLRGVLGLQAKQSCCATQGARPISDARGRSTETRLGGTCDLSHRERAVLFLLPCVWGEGEVCPARSCTRWTMERTTREVGCDTRFCFFLARLPPHPSRLSITPGRIAITPRLSPSHTPLSGDGGKDGTFHGRLRQI